MSVYRKSFLIQLLTYSILAVCVLLSSPNKANAAVITTTVNGGGTVTQTTTTSSTGTKASLTASPNADSKFGSWSGACSGTLPTCSISRVSNSKVTATFLPVNKYTLTATSDQSSGTIKCDPACGVPLVEGTTVLVVAVPASGYTFAGWSGACTGSNSCNVTLSNNASIVASFNKIVVPADPIQSSCDVKMIEGFDNSAIAKVEKPVKGKQFTDVAYKTCVVRATDYAADGVSGFARNDYSRRQAFNSDSSKFIVYSLNGFWHLYDAKTFARIGTLNGPAADAEPQWHATNPDLLYYIPTNGVGMKLYELNVVTGVSRVVGDFTSRVKSLASNAMAVWTKSEGSPSANGRYWCFMVDSTSWGSIGVFTWDRDTDTILGYYNTNGERPDHVSMSPSGRWCVVSGDGPRGTVAFSRDFSVSKKLLAKSEHSDIALDANGNDVYVSVDYQSGNGSVFMVDIDTGVRTDLFATYAAGTATALHVSGKAFNKPGWALVSTYADYGGAQQWLHKKVFAVKLTANPTIYNIAHTHAVANGYWTEPHASVNRDFTKVIFNSNWGVNSDTNIDAYVVTIPKF